MRQTFFASPVASHVCSPLTILKGRGFGRESRQGPGCLASGVAMHLFGWLGGGDIPRPYDLSRLGWHRVDLGSPLGQASLPLLVTDPALSSRLTSRRERAPVALIGVEDPAERAQLLALGFGEALPGSVGLEELARRTQRVAETLDSLPRRRIHGAVTLDLLLRDGWVEGRRIGLHPREFALLWRLAENPGEAVGSDSLLNDVWNLHFRPETNSLAVHICRLRAKLTAAGLPQMVETTPGGSYVLAPAANATAGNAPAIPLAPRDDHLDNYVREAARAGRAVAASEGRPEG